MKKIGLTGNIGSGKSLIADIFESMGVAVFQADKAGHEALNESEIIQELLKRWGSHVLQSNTKQPNRKAIAEIVFKDENELSFLNELIHPVVLKYFEKWCLKYEDKPYVIHEAAILFESGFHTYFDKIIFVSAPQALRIQRVMQRDGLQVDDIINRMNRQWPEDMKIPLADYIIQNDEQHPLIPQVVHIHELLSKPSNF
ncbi:MAG: dephospho-CoA kinase [Lentimicrobium sp.]